MATDAWQLTVVTHYLSRRHHPGSAAMETVVWDKGLPNTMTMVWHWQLRLWEDPNNVCASNVSVMYEYGML